MDTQSGPGIADRITAWREWAGLSRPDLASALNVSVQAVRYWECGRHPPTQRHLEDAIALFGISFVQFWGALPPKRDVA